MSWTVYVNCEDCGQVVTGTSSGPRPNAVDVHLIETKLLVDHRAEAHRRAELEGQQSLLDL